VTDSKASDSKVSDSKANDSREGESGASESKVSESRVREPRVRNEKWPERDELVVATITKIFPHGAFAKIEEYDREGMIHISELSPKWVKDVRDVVQEGKRVVAQVLKIDRDRGHIDLSMKRLSDGLVRQKMREWKNEQRAQKLIDLCAHRLKKVTDAPEVIAKIEEEYGLIFEAFESAATGGKEIFEKAGLSPEWCEELAKIASENIENKEIFIMGFVELKSNKPEGVNDIKKALMEIEKSGGAVQYVGSPIYRIKISGEDYKSAEKKLKEMADKAIQTLKKAGGEGMFHRELDLQKTKQ